MPCPSGEVHHRRGRSVVDEHRHCPCNLTYICGSCHRWVHAHPFEARGKGLIISRFVEKPWTVAQVTVQGERSNLCDGTIEYLH